MSDFIFFNYARSALYFGVKNLLLEQKNQSRKKILIPSYISVSVQNTMQLFACVQNLELYILFF